MVSSPCLSTVAAPGYSSRAISRRVSRSDSFSRMYTTAEALAPSSRAALPDRVKKEMAANFPDVRTFFQSGSMQDAILNQGQPAPIDVQVNTRDLKLTDR